MKRIRVELTQAEVSVIFMMMAIATAGTQDGDYAPWTKKDWRALETLREKVAIGLPPRRHHFKEKKQ